jgi:hypothetical protein
LTTGGTVSATGNVQAGNLRTAGLISATGNIDVGNVNTAGLVTAGNLSATGNITTTANLSVGNATVTTQINTASVSASGNIRTAGTVSATGNVDSGNLRTGGVVSATGTVTGGNIVTPGFITATGNINSQGVISASGNIVTAGSFVGNFQGNIVGNLTVPGSNTQILFNTSGAADAVAGLSYNKDSNTLSVLGVISSQGNVQAGNLRTAGQVSATGNITGNILSAVANVVTGNLIISGNVSTPILNGNIGLIPDGTGLVTVSTGISAVGNVTGNFILGNGALLTGIDATSIQNGNSNVRVVGSGGNIVVGVGGVSNVAVFSPTGLNVSNLTVNGNLFTPGIYQPLDDVSPRFDNEKAVFPLTLNGVPVGNITNSQDMTVQTGGATLVPYVPYITWPWTPIYDSWRGFRVKSDATGSNVIIYNSPAIGDSFSAAVVNNSQTVIVRRYPFTATNIAIN